MTSPRPRRPLATAAALAAVAAVTVSAASLVPVPPAFALPVPVSSSPVDAAVASPVLDVAVPAPVVAQLTDTARRVTQPPRGDTALRPTLTPQQIEQAITDGRQRIAQVRDTTLALRAAEYNAKLRATYKMLWESSQSQQERVYVESEVDVKAAPVLPLPAFAYPGNLRAARVEGTVVAQFVVGPDGMVRLETFKEVSSSHPLFTDAVRRNLRELRFTPALRARVAVPQLVQMPMEFVLRAPGDTASLTAVTVVATRDGQQPDTAAIRRRLAALQLQLEALQQEMVTLRRQLNEGGTGTDATRLPVPADVREAQLAAARKVIGSARIYEMREVANPVKLAPGNRAPPYPVELRAAGIEGMVVLSFIVGPDGAVIPGTAYAVRSDHTLFTDAVLAHLPSMRFVAGTVNGVGVAQIVQQPFVFSLGR